MHPALFATSPILSEKEVPNHMVKNFISNLLARFQSNEEEGQTLVEYGLLLALIAIIVIVALIFLGRSSANCSSNVATPNLS